MTANPAITGQKTTGTYAIDATLLRYMKPQEWGQMQPVPQPPQKLESSRVKFHTPAAVMRGLIIPPSKKCTYCHNINTGGRSLHEIHGSNLTNICSKCHLKEMSKGSVTTVMKSIGNSKQNHLPTFLLCRNY